MQKLLQTLIETGNPELIQKFIQKYLPKQPNNLQRIYNQLNHYEPPKKSTTEQPITIRQIQKKSRNTLNETPIQNSIRRTKSVLALLKEKGLQVTEQDFQKGLNIVEKEKERVMKPLKINPVARFLKKGKINDLAKKYQLNKEFYQNPPVGFQFDQAGFDPDMFDYIEKRKKLLKSIYQKKLSQTPDHKIPRKYQSTQSKINTGQIPTQSSASLPTLQPQPNSLSLHQIKNQSKQIMHKCSQISAIQITQRQSHNLFDELKIKLDRMEDIDIDEALKTKVKENPISQKLERYNLAYMTHLKQKEDYRSMGSHKKELLKDQIKMRGIVDFQD